MDKNVRTRFAPSPTGFMHVGNLRTALYAYLYARHEGGKFILRIEDTDQKRYVEGATDVIYNTLKTTGMNWDEGPDIGGNYGSYVQSERKDLYKKYAEELVKTGHAYYCFCAGTHEEHESESDEEHTTYGYNRKCRNLSPEEVKAKLESGASYVIRQKIPLEGTTTFHDEVYGDITVNNDTLDDQILLKSDGLPTYNFANVVDDHLMKISHVMRGREYISSTPKYQLLYEAFGWTPPKTVHLSLIMGQNPDGTISKLSKRHGSTTFDKLMADGYLQEAVINYIALLGWSPKDDREFFTLEEMAEVFSLDGIVKSNAVFDYNKLAWMNSEYIKKMPFDKFVAYAKDFIDNSNKYVAGHKEIACSLAQSRINKFSDINDLFKFLEEYNDFNLEMLCNKKNKVTIEGAKLALIDLIPKLENLQTWNCEEINNLLMNYATEKQVKVGYPMWVIRIAATASTVTPGGAGEMLELLGKDETINRLKATLNRL